MFFTFQINHPTAGAHTTHTNDLKGNVSNAVAVELEAAIGGKRGEVALDQRLDAF